MPHVMVQGCEGSSHWPRRTWYTGDLAMPADAGDRIQLRRRVPTQSDALRLLGGDCHLSILQRRDTMELSGMCFDCIDRPAARAMLLDRHEAGHPAVGQIAANHALTIAAAAMRALQLSHSPASLACCLSVFPSFRLTLRLSALLTPSFSMSSPWSR